MPSPFKALCGAVIAILPAVPPTAAEESTVERAADPVRMLLGDSITWGGGSQAEVTVANLAASAIGHTTSQIWGGTASGSVTVTSASYNGTVDPSASTTFGFIASGPGAAAVGSATCASP